MRQSKRKSRTMLSYHIMISAGMLWLIFFNIVPMFGIVMAFQDFNPGLGFLHSKFVGLGNFEYLFSMSDSRRVIANTFIIAVSKLILNVVVPLTFALLLNEVGNLKFKKAVQTVVYLPHFLSWVILASVLLQIFSLKGSINGLLSVFGIEGKIWFSEDVYFRNLVIGSDVWKEFGFNAVIYLAALTGISPELYEAAAIDGCGKLKSIWHITLPGIAGTVVLLSVLGLGNVLNAGFDQVFNLYSPLVYSTGDILDTWVFRMGLVDVQFSLATTAGLFKSVISFILVVTSYLVAYKVADYKVF
ncbi:ABC transporter permease [Scatolibacter rhodanostii]|uniref:ABC transporter permease n=1 Tax=Scatolibacter rhodanostii TaxID=2014781 RepID=UPI00278BE9A1|nr:ABC transporter permease subunit [Scatolibacter rhodanostii]